MERNFFDTMAAELRRFQEECREPLPKRIRREENPETRGTGQQDPLQEHAEELSETEKLRRNIPPWLEKYPVLNHWNVNVCEDVKDWLWIAKNEVESTVQSTLKQFHFLEVSPGRSTAEDGPAPDCAESNLRREVKELLDRLGITDYYPQKLTFQDVVKLTSDVHNNVDTSRPGNFKEMVAFFLQGIMRLDSNTRKNYVVAASNNRENDCSVNDYKNEDSDDDDEDNLNPLDLIYAIFLCADDILRQELTDRMSKCQYAVPFILPSADSETNPRGSTVIHWGLKNIVRTFWDSSTTTTTTKTLVEMRAPLLACVGFGEDTWWKSQLLNKMLSPHQEAFWYPGLTNGGEKQIVSEGMVEVGWSLPGTDEDMFCRPVAIANIRQNVEKSTGVYLELLKSSSVVCLFAEEINYKVTSFLKVHRYLNNILLIVLHKKGKLQKGRIRELQKQFLNVKNIIRFHFRNVSTVSEQLQDAVKEIITSTPHVTSLSDIAAVLEEKNLANVDDNHCRLVHKAAESILGDVDEHNRGKSGSAKGKILPWSSDLETRQEIAALEKELCRQKKKSENVTVKKYGYDIKREKWQLQHFQLKEPVSDTFRYFLLCLINMTTNERRYFLPCLKLGLNQRSVELLEPLRRAYEKCQLEEEGTERDEHLKDLELELTNGSLGLEHFFREMAVVYDNMFSLRSVSDNRRYKEVDAILEVLACLMAELVMDGTAIEIMDGDARNVHVHWICAILQRVQQSSDSKLFNVSVLGAQSCGKSTLLNTIFGLNFPVDSGRCTRGAYMQLVKVDESLKETLKCDYVAVIDTEGLMSRSKVDSTEYDNELATFIIGLSDLTLVIIKGEGNEMNDVLPLAIHACLRMNIVGLGHRACHFVHQNTGAVDTRSKVATEMEVFVRQLNTKTKAAAGEVGLSDKYKKFSDILQCDPIKDNTYVPGLWDGTPPMAKYSKAMQILKKNILNLTTGTKTRLSFTELSALLKELWQGIKYEKFVLSFRNILTIEAHKKLSKVFHEAQWSLKRELQDLMMKEKNRIENKVLGCKVSHSEKDVVQLIHCSSAELTNTLMMKRADLQSEIEHYFKCDGCNKCSASVTNRHLLRDHENEFMEEVNTWERILNDLIRESMKKFEFKMKMERWKEDRDLRIDDIIREKVEEAVRKGISKDMSSEDMNAAFDSLWEDVTADIKRTIRQEPQDENTVAAVQTSIKTVLGSDHQYYLQMLGHDSSRQTPKETAFEVDRERHIHLIVGASPAFVTDADISLLQASSDTIFHIARKHWKCAALDGGKQFHSQLADDLFLDVMKELEKINEPRFKVTWNYKTDLLFHVQTLAVTGFTQMHEDYRSHNSAEAILQRKKKSCRDVYANKLGHGNAALDFSENFLKDLILRNVDEELSCAELFHDLKLRCGDIFRDIKSVHASIMVDLYLENKFEKYLHYIESYECHTKDKLEWEAIKHFTEKNRFFEIAEMKQDQIGNTILAALTDAVNSCTRSNLIKKFLSKMDKLKISYSEAAAYLQLDIPNKQEFASIVSDQLNGRLKESIRQTVRSWNVRQKIKDRNLRKFIFKEIVGCRARCPFCKVPCDNHSSGKTGGKHSATVLRVWGDSTGKKTDGSQHRTVVWLLHRSVNLETQKQGRNGTFIMIIIRYIPTGQFMVRLTQTSRNIGNGSSHDTTPNSQSITV